MYPISTFWHGPMSDMEILCLKSWLGHGHPVHLYTYDDISNLPVGVICMDAREIIPEGPTIYDGPMPKTATKTAFEMMPFADRFRFTMLRLNGGLWLDLDIILVRPIPDELFERDFWCSSERTLQAGAYKSKETYKPNIGALYVSEPEHPLMCAVTEWDGSAKDAWHGMKIFNKLLKKLDLVNAAIQPSAFCDLAWMNVKDICVTVSDTEVLPTRWGVPGCSVRLPAEAVGVHCWRGLLRKEGLPYGKADVSPLSYLGRLYQHAETVYQERLSLL